jgi:hypothetical protein
MPRQGIAAMSGRRSPFLQRRSGVYHLRVRVPDQLRLRVGLLEVRRSLRVHSSDTARLLAAIYVARVKEVFEMVKASELSKAAARELLRTCFEDLAQQVERFAPHRGLDIDEQKHFAHERVRELSQQLKYGEFEPDIETAATRLSAAHGCDLPALTWASRHDVISGVARALAEQQRLFLHRLEERLLPYTPTDPLFDGCGSSDAPASDLVTVRGAAQPVGPTCREAVDRHLAAKRASWTTKTHVARNRQLAYLVEHLGPETLLSRVSCADLRGYRDAVMRLRSNHHVGAGKSFAARQTDAADKRISAKTASLIFETAKAFFNWAKADGYLGDNPASGLRLETPKVAKTHKARRPFNAAELESLFAAPVYRGCKSIKRRFDPGTLIARDAYYWIPILAYLTGARLGELVQLHAEDERPLGSG